MKDKSDKPLDPLFLKEFHAFCEEIAEGGKHKECMQRHRMSWKYMDGVMRWHPELKEEYQNAKRTRDELWKAQIDDEMHRRAIEGVEEEVITPKGQIIKIKNTDSWAAIRLYDEAHPKKVEAKVEGNLNDIMLASLRAASERPAAKSDED